MRAELRATRSTRLGRVRSGHERRTRRSPRLDKALEAAELGKLRFHDLRHGYASLLIAEGLNVVFVSRQLGHSSPDITLRVYAHLFDAAEHAGRARAVLEGVLSVSGSSS